MSATRVWLWKNKEYGKYVALALDDLTFKLIWESLKNFAKAKEVAALANSEGCIVKLPRHTNNVDQLWF
jgi:hypothetical protein